MKCNEAMIASADKENSLVILPVQYDVWTWLGPGRFGFSAFVFGVSSPISLNTLLCIGQPLHFPL